MSKKDEFNALSKEKKEALAQLFTAFTNDPMLSYQKLADVATAMELKLDRKQVAKLMDDLGYPKRTPEMVTLSRKTLGTQGKQSQTKSYTTLLEQVSPEELKTEYATSSLSQLAEKYNTTAYTVQRALEHVGAAIRPTTPTYQEVITILAEGGMDKELISTEYTNGQSFSSFQKKLQELSGVELSESSIRRLLKHLGISKDTALIRKQQGEKSRREKILREEKLKSIGFASYEDAAKFYNEHVEYTQGDFIKMLNEKLGYEEFGEKWFQRNIQPFVPHRSKNNWGVSREESGLVEWMEEVLPPGTFIRRNVRDLIPPREVDIYIPSLKLAIEYNGLPWHTREYMMKARGIDAYEFHKEKLTQCAAKGVNLIYVWSDDWAVNQEEVKKLLKKQFALPSTNIPQLKKLLSSAELHDNSPLFLEEQKIIDKRIAKLYAKTNSVSQVATKLNSSRGYIRASLKRSGISTAQVTYLTVSKALKEKGVTEDALRTFYVTQNHTRAELANYIAEKGEIETPIGMDLVDRLIRHYNLQK